MVVGHGHFAWPDNLQLLRRGLVYGKLWGGVQNQLVHHILRDVLLRSPEAIGIESVGPLPTLQALTNHPQEQPRKFDNRQTARRAGATSISIDASKEVLVELESMCIERLQQPCQSRGNETEVQRQSFHIGERLLVNMLPARVEEHDDKKRAGQFRPQEIDEHLHGLLE